MELTAYIYKRIRGKGVEKWEYLKNALNVDGNNP